MQQLESDAHSSSRSTGFVWIIALALAAVQGALLTRGYRITGDDVLFYEAALRGLSAAAELTRTIAEGQGRIGAYLIIPINIASAYLSDWLAFRLFAVFLYFLVFLLFALWVQRLLRKPVAAAIFLLLVAFNVTDYLHLPPVSYPLQNTTPFILVIGARTFLLSEDHDAGSARGRLARIVALLAFGLGMLASEYGFLLGTAMLGSEYLRQALPSRTLAGAVRRLFSPSIWPSLLVCVVTFAAYLSWRLAFSSTYDGNQLAPLTRLPHGLLTGIAHILTLYALPSASLLRSLPFPGGGWLLAALCVGIAAAIAFAASGRLLAGVGGSPAIVPLALLAALYTVLPASMTIKQQVACLEHLGCAFLDSQIAYLAATVAIAAAAGWLIGRSKTDTSRKRATALLSALVGMGSAMAFYHDKRVSDDMHRIAQIWRKAALTACRDDLPAVGLDRLMDPETRLSTHPDFDREAFWQAFVAERRPACP